MTFVATSGGMLWPHASTTRSVTTAALTSRVMDAADEGVAFIGHVYIDGRPASAKTISAAGGGSITFRAGAVTFANGATTLDVGIQDVGTAGPPGEPDATFDVKRTLTGGTDTINANVNNTFAMTGGTGSKSITQGDLIAITLLMTARGGADSVAIAVHNFANATMPFSTHRTAGAWGTSGEAEPAAVIITFDDGTIATLDGLVAPGGEQASTNWADSDNPDERGQIFQLPWDCKIDALWMDGGITDADSDFTLILYADPLGTPAALATVTINAATLGTAGNNQHMTFPLATEVSLTRNTDYCVALRATGTSNVRLLRMDLASAAARAFYPGGLTSNAATRDGGSGAFTEDDDRQYMTGVRFSSLHDTGGGAPAQHGNMTGGMQ